MQFPPGVPGAVPARPGAGGVPTQQQLIQAQLLQQQAMQAALAANPALAGNPAALMAAQQVCSLFLPLVETSLVGDNLCAHARYHCLDARAG